MNKKELKSKIRDLNKQSVAAKAAYTRGEISKTQYGREVNNVNRQIIELKKEVRNNK